jgi:phage tail protein X
MTIDDQELRAISWLACRARPVGARRWDEAKVFTEAAKVRERSLSAVALAVLRAAADRNAERPEVISSAGSHWGDTIVPGAFVPRAAPTGTRCTVCGKAAHTGHEDHPFTLPAEKPDPETVAAKVAALKAELAPTAGPTARRTLEDMAAANPDLHARVEAVRAANPGLAAPPLREPQPPPPPDPAVVETEQQVTEEAL